MSVETVTLGCRLNFAESETIAARRRGARTGSWSTAAPSPTRRCARRARLSAALTVSVHRAKILVTGCASELDPAAFAAMPGVSRVVGNSSKLNSSGRK